jgi:ankyrin repeat protein
MRMTRNYQTPFGVAAIAIAVLYAIGCAPRRTNVYTRDVGFAHRLQMLDALDKNDFRQMKRLRNAGVDMNFAYRDGETLLMRAAAVGRLEAIRFILDSGANPDQADRYGYTALDLSISNNRYSAFLLLRSRGAKIDPDSTSAIPPAVLAAGNVPIEYLRDLAVEGANLNCQSPRGDTPLHEAVRSRNVAAVTLLLQHRVYPLKRNNAGQTAKDIAIEMRCPEIEKLLP